MNAARNQKGSVILIVIAAIAAVVIGLLLLSTLAKTNKTAQPTSLVGDSAKSQNANNKMLQAACKNAANDYPEWTKTPTDLIIWENPDKSFNFRNSPEDASTKLTSPILPTETLVDMDFVGENEISYAVYKNAGWKLRTLKLNGLNVPTNSLVYEKNESVTHLATSPINKNEYIILAVSGAKGWLKYVNTTSSKEESLLELTQVKTDNLKLTVSPKGTYVYLLQGGSILVFDTTSKNQVVKIDPAESAVWVGNEHLLYSEATGTYIYNLKSKEKSKLDQPGEVAQLTFNPEEGGVIAFDEGGNTKIVGCQTGKIINSKEGAAFKTLTGAKTAITQKGDNFGYWRFKDKDWDVKILEDKSKYVTVWQRY